MDFLYSLMHEVMICYLISGFLPFHYLYQSNPMPKVTVSPSLCAPPIKKISYKISVGIHESHLFFIIFVARHLVCLYSSTAPPYLYPASPLQIICHLLVTASTSPTTPYLIRCPATIVSSTLRLSPYNSLLVLLYIFSTLCALPPKPTHLLLPREKPRASFPAAGTPSLRIL